MVTMMKMQQTFHSVLELKYFEAQWCLSSFLDLIVVLLAVERI